MTREEFFEWRSHSVTQEIYKEIRQLIEDGRSTLAVTAGSDSIQDARTVGKIAGLQAVLDISFEGDND